LIRKLILVGLIGACLFLKSASRSYAFNNEYSTVIEESTVESDITNLEKEILPELVPPLILDEFEEPKLSDTYSAEDIDLLARMTLAEAEGESEEGKRLVVDTILNRVDSPSFPNSIRGVIYEKHQFTSINNGRMDRMIADKYIINLVKEEIDNRTDKSVIFFRTKRYHSCGVALFKCGNHYFSREE
jgi:hypothetical protein